MEFLLMVPFVGAIVACVLVAWAAAFGYNTERRA